MSDNILKAFVLVVIAAFAIGGACGALVMWTGR